MPEKQFERLKKRAGCLPDSPGCYLFKNGLGAVLYVGKALSLKKRTASYFNRKAMENPKVRSLLGQAQDIEIFLAADENQALLLESNLIKRHRPRYNILLETHPKRGFSAGFDFAARTGRWSQILRALSQLENQGNHEDDLPSFPPTGLRHGNRR